MNILCVEIRHIAIIASFYILSPRPRFEISRHSFWLMQCKQERAFALSFVNLAKS